MSSEDAHKYVQRQLGRLGNVLDPDFKVKFSVHSEITNTPTNWLSMSHQESRAFVDFLWLLSHPEHGEEVAEYMQKIRIAAEKERWVTEREGE
jgi:hypothetical protein